MLAVFGTRATIFFCFTCENALAAAAAAEIKAAQQQDKERESERVREGERKYGMLGLACSVHTCLSNISICGSCIFRGFFFPFLGIFLTFA